MNKIVIILLIFGGAVFAQNYELVWSDEFDGTVLNESDWIRETGGHGWGNNEWQHYTNRTQNAYIEDGKLVIKAMKENYGGNEYTSARLKTQGRKNWTYGKFEARMKLPYGQGIWPAFWMLGESISSVGWPSCGEIDIMEMVGGQGRENTTHGTIHWNQNGHNYSGMHYTISSGTLADDFHVYAIEWTPTEIKWYLDGIHFHSESITSSERSEFHAEHFFILNLAVGGNWPGYPDASTVFPQYFEIDYVRVYEDNTELPEVSVSLPNGSSIFPYGEDIEITSDVSFDGEIEKVEFFQDGVLISETNVEPFKMIWRNVESGSYHITAKVTTAEGYKAVSSAKNVIVDGSADNYPVTGTAHLVPGYIQAEEFDLGGQGLGYSDADNENRGGSFRIGEGVDIENCSDIRGGYNVGYISSGEWLKYTVNVSRTGTYVADFRVASTSDNGKFRLEVDGQDVTGIISVASTGDWQAWTDITSPTFELTEGKHEFRLFFTGTEFNINYFSVFENGTDKNLNLIYPAGSETLKANQIYEVAWSAEKVWDVKIGITTNGGTSWSFITEGVESRFGAYRFITSDIESDECRIMVVDAANSSVLAQSEPFFTITNSTNVSFNKGELSYTLEQNYPNPFNPATNIAFTILDRSNVKIEIFDSMGELVRILTNNLYEAGRHTLKWNSKNDKGEHVSSGLYIYRISTPKFNSSQKMLLLK